jgi:predicted ArsR family transcriptional regulator
MTKGGRRYSAAERERRRAIVLRLWNAGHGQAAIARALGVSKQAVRSDLAVLLPDRVRDGSRRDDVPDPPYEEWRDALPGIPPAPVPTANRPDAVTAILQGTGAQLRQRQYRNAFANTALRNMGNPAWLRSAGDAVEGMEEICHQLRRILTDQDYARQMATSAEGRDDLRTPARVR